LRSTGVPRAVGGALVVFAAAWFLLFAAMLGYGHVPDVTNLVATGLMAAASVAIGDTLQDETDAVVSAEPRPDSTV
jgi:putative exporter of polyketide antibiotics